jgi:hypothetical protein
MERRGLIGEERFEWSGVERVGNDVEMEGKFGHNLHRIIHG